jgi:hypothetical protein
VLPKVDVISTLYRKAIATIISKATKKLADTLGKKEDSLYKKSTKRYHQNLKTAAGLQPKVKDQPNLSNIRDPNTNEITAEPHHILTVLQTHFKKEQSRNTPEDIPLPPWQNPLNPDPYTTPRKGDQDAAQHTLDHYLTRGHYAAACDTASVGKDPSTRHHAK